MKCWIALIALGGIWMAASSVPGYCAKPEPAIEITNPIRSEGTAISIDVTDSDTKQVLDELSRQLGSPVVLAEPIDAALTVKFTGLPASKALDKVATALGCKWKRRYTLFKKVPDAAKVEHRPSGKLVTISAAGLEVAVVAKQIAKAASGTVVIPSDITGKVSLKADNVSVEEAMSSICAKVGAEWNLEFVLTKSADLKAPEPPKVKPPDKEEPVTRIESKKRESDKPAANSTKPKPNPEPKGPSQYPNTAPMMSLFGNPDNPDQMNARISESLNSFFNLSPDDRRQRIQTLAENINASASHMDQADPASLNAFFQRMGPAFRSASGIVGQLPPERRAELKPLSDAIDNMIKKQKELQQPPK